MAIEVKKNLQIWIRNTILSQPYSSSTFPRQKYHSSFSSFTSLVSVASHPRIFTCLTRYEQKKIKIRKKKQTLLAYAFFEFMSQGKSLGV